MWYRVADEEGFLIQDEFPIWYGGKGWCVWPEELKADELAKEFSEWMHERWNHPSVVIWDGSNENVSHNLDTEEIADAIKRVRSLDMSARPWDNSYSLVREIGDVVECHPYHFIKNTYKFSDIAKAIDDPVVHHQYIWPDVRPNDNRYIKIINEYAWLWLNRDGKPTTLTGKLYRNLLGADSTIEQRRHVYAPYLAAETEFWRCHRKANGVLHFTALAYSRDDGNTSDHFTDVKNLVYEEEFLKYMPDAFSPVGLMLDEWGIEIHVNGSHSYKIIAINDLEPEWKGSVKLQIMDRQEVIAEKTTELAISPFGQANTTISLKGPQKPGIYTVIATLVKTGEKPVRSVREIPFI